MNAAELAKILGENADLPILCMVDGDICADDSCRRWAGSIESAEVKEYVCINPDAFETYGQAIFWKEDADELADLMCDSVPNEKYDEAHKMAEETVANMNWIKAIVIYVGMPEE